MVTLVKDFLSSVEISNIEPWGKLREAGRNRV